MIDITPPDEFLEARHWGARCITVTPYEFGGLLNMPEFVTLAQYARDDCILKWELGRLYNARVILTVLR